MVVTAFTAAGISSGRAEPMPSTKAVTSCTAASIRSGRLSMRAETMVMTASTAAGISWGRSVRSVSSTCVNRLTTVDSSVGSSSPTACRMPSKAAGRAATMFSITGVMFLTTF